MRISKSSLIVLLFCSSLLAAQVLSPMEMTDPAMRRLQQSHFSELKSFATEINQHKFPYAFYFSRKLDIEEQVQKQVDQRSIRFERHDNKTTLEITGNYYASYAAERVDADHRFRQTFIDVILPILQSAASKFGSEQAVESIGIEVSHHVRKTVLGGIKGEFPENVVVLVPRELAVRVAHASDLATQQTLMLDAEAYLSGQPTLLWLAGDKPIVADDRPPAPTKEKQEAASLSVSSTNPPIPGAKLPTLTPAPVPTAEPALVTSPAPAELKNPPPHEATPQALATLQEQQREAIDRMTREQNASAHFVTYAPPAFIEFKNGVYLQLSMTSTLQKAASSSQYNHAALAFDQHISHLVRPILAYFKDSSSFDGILFSTTIKTIEDKTGTHAESVEFVLPMTALRSYAQYDCTGQQLLNAGIVLINGDRVGLDLQTAEAR